MSNDPKIAKIQTALNQLDPTNDQHWTDDGLPREGVVRKLASDQTISRKEIQEARPGFQRTPAPVTHDPVTGEPVVAEGAAPGSGSGGIDPSNIGDPSKNTGELMTESEVRGILEGHVKAANSELEAARLAVLDAHKREDAAKTAVQGARTDFAREYPPLTPALNVKQYIASEQAERARAAANRGYSAPTIAPGSQIDAAMQKGNSRGWRRQVRTGPADTRGANAA